MNGSWRWEHQDDEWPIKPQPTRESLRFVDIDINSEKTHIISNFVMKCKPKMHSCFATKRNTWELWDVIRISFYVELTHGHANSHKPKNESLVWNQNGAWTNHELTWTYKAHHNLNLGGVIILFQIIYFTTPHQNSFSFHVRFTSW